MHISYCTFSPYFYHRLRLINITTFCECQGIILILHSVRDNADYLRSENTRPRCPYLCIIFFFQSNVSHLRSTIAITVTAVVDIVIVDVTIFVIIDIYITLISSNIAIITVMITIFFFFVIIITIIINTIITILVLISIIVISLITLIIFNPIITLVLTSTIVINSYTGC